MKVSKFKIETLFTSTFIPHPGIFSLQFYFLLKANVYKNESFLLQKKKIQIF